MTRRALLCTAFAPALSPGTPPGASPEYARRIFNRANELRVLRGAPALEWWEPLAACAREQSFRKQALRFAGHDDPERGGVAERLSRAGIRWSRCAENLFSMRGYDDPVNFAIVFWWYSAGHQANLLAPAFTRTGVGVVEAADGTFFTTQLFVTP